MKNNFLKVFSAFFFALVFSFSVSYVFAAGTDGIIDPDHGEAVIMTEGRGSLYFNTTNGDIVVSDTKLSGYAWGDVIGWVNLDPSGGGVANDGAGNLSGYAWGEQSGWINFSPTNGGVTIDADGFFHGYAWAESAGWISFNCEEEGVCGSDNYYVKTTWPAEEEPEEPTNPGGGCTGNCGPTPPPEEPPCQVNCGEEPPCTENCGPVVPPTEPPCEENCSPTQPPPSVPPGTPPPPGTNPPTPPKIPGGPRILELVPAASAISLAAITLTSVSLFATPLAAAEIPLIPARVFALFSVPFRRRKKERPWGIVYDSITKQPLDPVYVVLKDVLGKEVASSITDLDGRFGFFVPKGTYYLSAEKIHYGFPSVKLRGQPNDAIYDNLYFGEQVVVNSDGEVISKNIPMDPEAFDWNEFAKTKMKVLKFNPRREAMMARISDFLFVFGFAVAIAAMVFTPGVYNAVVLLIYIVFLGIRLLGLKPKKHGIVSEAATHSPLSFAAVSIYSNALQAEMFKKIADKDGRYYALVPKGNYVITVSKKDENNGENYIEVGKRDYFAKNGVINLDLAV